MALQIISALLFTAFFSKALTLECYNCSSIASSATCTHTANCPSDSQCRYLSTYNGITQRSCAGLCGNWSINVGQYNMSSYCCAVNRCNNATAAASENKLMCYTCSDTNCTKTLKCKGDENRCITATAELNSKNSTVKGCASQSICNNRALVNPVGLTVFSASCCEANLCNSARSTTPGLFLLVPVLSFLIFI